MGRTSLPKPACGSGGSKAGPAHPSPDMLWSCVCVPVFFHHRPDRGCLHNGDTLQYQLQFYLEESNEYFVPTGF